MLTHVEFRSDQFPAYDGEERKINPGVFGKRVAEFLADHFQTRESLTSSLCGISILD